MEVPADTVSVAFLGPLGTYSHQAARQFACGNAVTLYAHPSIHAAVQAGIAPAPRAPHSIVVVVPLSNSVQGPVLETFACLGDEATFGPHALKIVEEVDLRIAHALIVRQASHDVTAQLGNLRVVRSHPQALGQCSQFLAKRLPHAAREEAPSTAEAVALLQSDMDAAIGSELAAELSNAQVLVRGIQNSNGMPTYAHAENTTRFVVATCNPRDAHVAALMQAYRSRQGTSQDAVRTMYRISTTLQCMRFMQVAGQDAAGWHIVNVVPTTAHGHPLLLVELTCKPSDHTTTSIPPHPTSFLAKVMRSADTEAHIECLGTWRVSS
ncbi:hypothetical protein CBS9595_001788 [Malassezia furfur]|nr:hypothetical protein CBS9595_001788 [Malassezia furfur]